MEIKINKLTFSIINFNTNDINSYQIQRSGFKVCSFFFDEIIFDKILNKNYLLPNFSYMSYETLKEVKSEIKKHIKDYKLAIEKYKRLSVFQ